VVNLAFDQLSNDAGAIFAIGIIFAMVGSSRLFIAIDKCMTIIYRLPERSFLRQNLMALGALLLSVIIIILMLVASSVPTALMNIIPGGGGRFGVFVAGILVSLSVAFCLFEFIYWLTPNKKMTFRKTWCGALIAAITLEIFIILFPLYVRQFMSNYAGKIQQSSINFKKLFSFFV
jgi:YihY family inner membrane protein